MAPQRPVPAPPRRSPGGRVRPAPPRPRPAPVPHRGAPCRPRRAPVPPLPPGGERLRPGRAPTGRTARSGGLEVFIGDGRGVGGDCRAPRSAKRRVEAPGGATGAVPSPPVSAPRPLRGRRALGKRRKGPSGSRKAAGSFLQGMLAVPYRRLPDGPESDRHGFLPQIISWDQYFSQKSEEPRCIPGPRQLTGALAVSNDSGERGRML